MFENYDCPYNCTHSLCECCHIDMPEILMGWSGAEIIYDEKGNEIGLGFNQGSPIKLAFHFSGCVQNDLGELVDIDEFINSSILTFELLDFRHNVVYNTTFEGNCEDQTMLLELNKEATENLVPEIYYILLIASTETADYILFSPRDGLIHIS